MKKLINPKPTGFFVQAALNIMFNPTITSNAKVVYCYLMSQDNSYVPNYRDIEFKTGISNRSIQRAFIELKSIGVVVINRLPGRNNYQYIVNSDIDLNKTKKETVIKTTTADSMEEDLDFLEDVKKEQPKNIEEFQSSMNELAVSIEQSKPKLVNTLMEHGLSIDETVDDSIELPKAMIKENKKNKEEVLTDMVFINEKVISSIFNSFLTKKLLKNDPKGLLHCYIIEKLNSWIENKTWEGIKEGNITKEMFTQLKEAALDIKLNK